MRYFLLLLLSGLLFFQSCKDDEPESEDKPENLTVTYVRVGEQVLSSSGDNQDVVIDEPIEIRFSHSVAPAEAAKSIALSGADGQLVDLTFSSVNEDKLFSISHPVLAENSSYTLSISGSLKGVNNESFEEQVYNFTTFITPLVLEIIKINGAKVDPSDRIKDIDRNPQIDFYFNGSISSDDLSGYTLLRNNGSPVGFSLSQIDDQAISLSPDQTLDDYEKFRLTVSSNIENRIGRPFEGLDLEFYTQLDSTPKFPQISDAELLTKIQQQTFRYFWDFAHPASGMARERDTSGEIVTTGGSGFGVMALIIGMERGFITREQGVIRLHKIVDFLASADRFHGVWPHWLNGTTGEVQPFSTYDDGGDLVETSFMAAGLLAARQYLNATDPDENSLITRINQLVETIEWDWYTRDGQNVLYWHWSPSHGWEMDMKIQGYNEALITYVMAASSDTHPVSADVYHEGGA
ncbi:Ig-like domain-containing protein [Marinilabilia salmonicolor]|uniref:Ig-like domain-containing protein n=1 Tax=Marinilabilia salmonicolor TaxID=989 RepID=UPI000A77FA58|nr:Ig-like domain-containing protein [Marinilabilia salmonicolor]